MSSGKKQNTSAQTAQVEKDSASIQSSIAKQQAEQTRLLGDLFKSQTEASAKQTEAITTQVSSLGSLFSKVVSDMNEASERSAAQSDAYKSSIEKLSEAGKAAINGSRKSLGTGVPSARRVDTSTLQTDLPALGAGASRSRSFVASNPTNRRVFAT